MQGIHDIYVVEGDGPIHFVGSGLTAANKVELE